MSDEELKVYFEIFNECWKFFKKYSNPQDNEGFWNELIEDLENKTKKYKNYEFARKMLIQTEEEIEELLRRKGKNETN